jgi:hypothetical protein
MVGNDVNFQKHQSSYMTEQVAYEQTQNE